MKALQVKVVAKGRFCGHLTSPRNWQGILDEIVDGSTYALVGNHSANYWNDDIGYFPSSQVSGDLSTHLAARHHCAIGIVASSVENYTVPITLHYALLLPSFHVSEDLRIRSQASMTPDVLEARFSLCFSTSVSVSGVGCAGDGSEARFRLWFFTSHGGAREVCETAV